MKSCFDPGDARAVKIPWNVPISVAAVPTRDAALHDPKSLTALNDAY